ncbi:MAG: Zn-ribbon domain-containing OB-fold protein [Candidatus Diapherotrites archaeon]
MDGALPLIWRNFPERYNLIGNKCQTCGTNYFPARPICPNCRRKGKMVEKQMPKTGTIISFTKVFTGPSGFENETPYMLALIELDGGARLLSQIVDSDEKKISIGAKVKKVFRKISDTEAEGVIAYGYKFKVLD